MDVYFSLSRDTLYYQLSYHKHLVLETPDTSHLPMVHSLT